MNSSSRMFQNFLSFLLLGAILQSVVQSFTAPHVLSQHGPFLTQTLTTTMLSDSGRSGNPSGKKKNDTGKKKSIGGGFGSGSSRNKSTQSAIGKTKDKSSSTAAFGQRTVSLSSSFPYSGSVRPGIISSQRKVLDESIMKPDYWDNGTPKRTRGMLLPWMIEVKTAGEIAAMREAGRLARHVLDRAGEMVQPGVTTDEIDEFVHNEIVKNRAYPSPLNYHGFPKSCCTSVNEVICHGIPDNRKLVAGDIINLDITVYKDGYHGDCSEMFVVGPLQELPASTKQLLQVTYDCWISACNIVKPGVDYKVIGAVIEDYVTTKGFTTVKKFCGHGIGSIFHTNPNILHYRNNEPNGVMAAGHTFTIEPMICEGTATDILTWPDEWTATTGDGKLSAQFEHTLLVTPDGVEALTGKNARSKIQFWEEESLIHKGIWLGTTPSAIIQMDQIKAAAAQSTPQQ